ncbi:MAG TPA: trigger factor [Longimicrobiaceae bacterium]
MPAETSDLTIAVQEPSAWSRRLTITVPAERVQHVRKEISRQVAQNARLPGFRKGKLPPSLIERQFGPSIDQETIDRTIQSAYREALETEGLNPITQGKVDKIEYQKGEALSFEVELEVRPEVQLQRTGGFSLQRPASDVSEEDVDAVLERLQNDRANWEPLPEGQKPVLENRVTVEITADEGEEAAEPRTYRFILGEGQAIPAVEEAIMSLAANEEGDFTVTFPEDFPDEERRGQQQNLHIRLLEASSKVLPELNDDFAKTIGEFEDLAALRARVLEDLQADAKERADAEVRRQLIDQIIQANPFELPRSMVERYLDELTGHSHEDGHDHNHTPEEEAEIARFREQLRPQAEWSIKRLLIIDSVAEAEGLRATQDDIDRRVEELAERHNLTPTEVWLQLEKAGQLEVLERELTENKVFEHLLGQSTVA